MKKIGAFFLTALCYLSIYSATADELNRWRITKDGGIEWLVKQADTHTDHIEMSGKKISVILTYGVSKEGNTVLSKKLIFPMLRTIPNNTHASLTRTDNFNFIDEMLVHGEKLKEKPEAFYHKGFLRIKSTTNTAITTERFFYPSVDKASFIEKIILKNTGTVPMLVHLPSEPEDFTTPAEKGVDGQYIISTHLSVAGQQMLAPGKEIEVSVITLGRKVSEPGLYVSADYEFGRRKAFITSLSNQLILETPDPVVNKMFEFAKIRLTESIFDTKGGLMHSPGGGPFYAGIWANDQAEYVNPFFPFLGNAEGNESAINSYRLFASFMNPEYKPIPSSIISEGVDVWHGAGDRGDQAMIAYGAARFALAYGDKSTAEKLWPLIEWCLTYLEKKKNNEGVIPSDSDELEGRFPAGKINLATNSLAYGALVGASRLASSLGKSEFQRKYAKDAASLKDAINKYFGATVEGYKTYRYFDGNEKLRAWICLPLVMGIYERKDETARALLSRQLWTENGILTESGSKTFWDRATIYAFRGLYNAGFTDTATKYLSIYSTKRLLQDHVPYAIEAWPEGNKRHLSAESGLYCRIITEGLFGIEPLSLNSFTLKPVLPSGWNNMALKGIKAFGGDIDIHVSKKDSKRTRVQVFNQKKPIKDLIWDQDKPIRIESLLVDRK